MKKYLQILTIFCMLIPTMIPAFAYTTKYTPTGCVDLIQSKEAGKITIAGWSYDQDSSSTSIDIKAYIGSTCIGTLSASKARPDVNAAFNITGAHGFSDTLTTTISGTQTVVIKAVDLETKRENVIGSKSITIAPTSGSTTPSYQTRYAPSGCVDLIQCTEEGKVYVAGWAYDKDSSSTSLSIKVYANSTLIGTINANQSRPDVNNTFSISGSHGFSGNIVTTLSGSYTIYIKAVDLGSNTEYTIGSKSITIKGTTTTLVTPVDPTPTTPTYTTNYTPSGTVDLIQSTQEGKVYVAGWVYDKDSLSTAVEVNIYAGSTKIGTLKADQTRDDVNKAFNITGKHGYSGNVTTTLSGTYIITVKAVDLGSKKETSIGSKTITIKGTSTTPVTPVEPTPSTPTYTTNYTPSGTVDLIQSTQEGKVYVAGWVYDKDSLSTAVEVNVYAGSTKIGTLKADQTRDDVNKAFNITGKHGYSGNIETTLNGSYTITIKAVDLGSNKETSIGSKTITIKQAATTPITPVEPEQPEVEEIKTDYIPTGTVDSITSPEAGKIKISGWAYDKDETTKPLTIKAYIGATCVATTTTASMRPDVNSAYGLEGNHGYDYSFTTSYRGLQTVIIKAVDLVTNKEHVIGSRTISILEQAVSIKQSDAHFIGHRGYSSIAPENTVKSFTLAGQAGFWGCETDIYVTKDGEFICHHDLSLVRMTGVSNTARNMTLAEIKQLKNIDGNNIAAYRNDPTATSVATLEEYLQVCKQYNMVPIIEIKDGPYVGTPVLTNAELQTLYTKVNSIMGNSLVYYISFDMPNLTGLRMVLSQHGDITSKLQYLTYSPASVDFTTLQAYMISVDSNFTNVNADLVKLYQSKNIELGVWTVDSTTTASTLISYGIQNITSNVKLWN